MGACGVPMAQKLSWSPGLLGGWLLLGLVLTVWVPHIEPLSPLGHSWLVLPPWVLPEGGARCPLSLFPCGQNSSKVSNLPGRREMRPRGQKCWGVEEGEHISHPLIITIAKKIVSDIYLHPPV